MLNQVPRNSQTFYSKWFLDSINVEFGQESESILVDIVRYVIVNVHPPNEIIFGSGNNSDTIIQRFMFIGNLIQQQAHFIHQPWVLQAIFFDWIWYDETQPHSIMLVEPAMLLMYRSCENNPSMTDTLVEFLHNYVNYYQEARAHDFMRSVQRVLHDCQKTGVIKDIKALINHPKLKPDTQ